MKFATPFIRIAGHTTAIVLLIVVLCVAVLWVRSYFVEDAFTWGIGYEPGRTGISFRRINVFSEVGQVRLIWFPRRLTDATVPFTHIADRPPRAGEQSAEDTHYTFAGFCWTRSTLQGLHTITVPYWALLLTSATWPAFWAVRLWRQVRHRTRGRGFEIRPPAPVA